MARNPDWYRVKSFADFRSEIAEEGSTPDPTDSDEVENIGPLPEKFDDTYTLEDLRRTYEAKKEELAREKSYERKIVLEYFAHEFVKIAVIHNQTKTWGPRP